MLNVLVTNLSVLSFRLKFIPSGIKKQQSDKKVSALTQTTAVSKIRLQTCNSQILAHGIKRLATPVLEYMLKKH